MAEQAGWLVIKTHGFSGQGWERNEYLPVWPKGIEAGSQPLPKSSELGAEGSEPDDKKTVNDVQSNIPINIPTKNWRRGLKKFGVRGGVEAMRPIPGSPLS